MCVYLPEERGYSTFLWNFQKTIKGYNRNDCIIIAGDLKARTGNIIGDELIGPQNKSTLNYNDKTFTNFAYLNIMKIMNS